MISFVNSLKCIWSACDNNFTKKVIFEPYLTPCAKMKIPNTYCASTRHAQSGPRISFGYDLRCDGVQVTRTSSDGRMYRGNNNIPECENKYLINWTLELKQKHLIDF